MPLEDPDGERARSWGFSDCPPSELCAPPEANVNGLPASSGTFASGRICIMPLCSLLVCISNEGDAESIVLHEEHDAAVAFIETGEGDPRTFLAAWSSRNRLRSRCDTTIPSPASPISDAARSRARPRTARARSRTRDV